MTWKPSGGGGRPLNFPAPPPVDLVAPLLDADQLAALDGLLGSSRDADGGSWRRD